MTSFAGFPSGKNPYVPVPEVFFRSLLPEIEDVAELKVTLHLFWLLAQKRGEPRCVSEPELLGDRVLLKSLKRRGDPRPPEERVRQGLEKAVARGTILRVYLKVLGDDGSEDEVIGWYFFNTARSRRVVAELQGSELIPVRLLDVGQQRPAPEHGLRQSQSQESVSSPAPAAAALARVGRSQTQHLHIEIERPNIFVLYEQNIGLLSPLIADELRDAAERYPPEWIEAAFREAVEHNKRNWRYIRAILRRWETEGR
ncbi:MAG: DnaD domain protein [Thermogemmatispora sp.]|uniref:DnaD domain-containing protein n=1 Tax=Thermogemmatispora sp. TaxID=1968838 RepID=UPI0019DD07F2|nr:DnaD domain protein [Thermogemmatispora sp.]MBE3564873.1 DnaD domain protein [Thermogemmatispora sp.]